MVNCSVWTSDPPFRNAPRLRRYTGTFITTLMTIAIPSHEHESGRVTLD